MKMTEHYPAEFVLPLRVRLGLTQVELAERVGVSQPLVAHWESGRRVPNGPAAIILKQLDKKKRKKLERAS